MFLSACSTVPVAHGPATPGAAAVTAGAADPVAGVLGPIFARLQVAAPEGDEFSGAALGRGLETELATACESRGLWNFASLGTLDDLVVRLAAGAPVLVGLQPQVKRVDLRFLAEVLAVDRAAGQVTWRRADGERVVQGSEEFINYWRQVGYWMLTACRPEQVTWAPNLKEQVVRARVLAQGGRAGESVRDYEAVLAQRPADAALWAELGVALEAAGRGAEALTTYRRALAQCPENAHLMKCLARRLTDSGSALEEAEQLARRAVGVEPGSASALDTLGRVLLARGHFEPAEEVLLRARSLAAGLGPVVRGEISLHLARAHYGRGELARARAVAREALAECPQLAVPEELRLLVAQATASL